MEDAPDLGPPISVNRSGGFYEQGKEYPFAKKWNVASVVSHLWEANWHVEPTNMQELAHKSNVSAYYVKKVVHKLTTTGCLRNPCVTKLEKSVSRGVGLDFSVEEEVFLLALRINCLFHPNTDLWPN
jgi:hypothetical protein